MRRQSAGLSGGVDRLVRVSRRISTLLVVLVTLALAVVASFTVRVPLVAMGPGPVFDTLGSVEVPEGSVDDPMGGAGGTTSGSGEGDESTVAKPIIEITGAEPDSTEGVLDMTTVAVHQNLRFADALTLWLDPKQTVVPRDQVFPPDRTQQQVDEQNAQLMVGSENSAAAAAFRHLDLPMVPTVRGIVKGGAADGLLEEGDRILTIDGKKIADSNALVEYVSAKRPGDELDVEFERPTPSSSGDGAQPGSGDAKRMEETVKLTPGDPEEGTEPDQGYLGVMVGDLPANGTNVKINLDDSVGGPSAGLMFALAIVDKLSPGELTGGKHIAGTGEIDGKGEVGPIGGIRHKIVAAHDDGATTFLVPADNCAEAMTDPPEGIDLVKVGTLDDAVDALDALKSGREPQACTTG